MLAKLQEYDAKDVKDHLMINHQRSEENNNKNNDKIRFMFHIPDKDLALKCYSFFTHYNNDLRKGKKHEDFDIKEQIKIYLQKEEDIFVRHGDEEAELYNQAQEIERQMMAQ